MSRNVILENSKHQDLRVISDYGTEYGDAINQALVFPTEFHNLQREYPIYFRKSENGAFYSVVLLGLDKDENLYLENGKWDARYVPAVQARGPFSIALVKTDDDQGEPLIQIDLDHPRVSTNEGQPLFLEHGGNSAYLEYIIGVLKRIHVGTNVNEAFFNALNELNLLEEVSLELKLSEVETYSVPDLYTISASALNALSGEHLEAMNKQGLLELCFAVILSAGNTKYLLDRKMLSKSRHTQV